MFGFLILLATLVLSAQSLAQVPATMVEQMSTADHLKQPGWWPLKSDVSRSEYVGAQVCAECHQTLVKGQNEHSMAHTSMLPTQSALLGRGDAEYKSGPYQYKIYEQDSRVYYSVTKGNETFSTPLLWAFGSGSVGQSYLFEREGLLYEARMSFLHGLGFDLTPGHPQAVPESSQAALGRPIPADEQVKCFGCHTVASNTGEHFDPAQAMMGISCEGCHGPGASHVAMAKSGVEMPAMLFNPARLTPPQSVDFCGACHRAWWDVANVTDIHAIRFPTLRLEQSRCWGNGDPRLVCATCHDPHQPLVHELTAYDGKCLSCHRSGSPATASVQHMAAACSVATKDCVSCHMPKYEITGMKLTFTDHKIRVVKGKSFQN